MINFHFLPLSLFSTPPPPGVHVSTRVARVLRIRAYNLFAGATPLAYFLFPISAPLPPPSPLFSPARAFFFFLYGRYVATPKDEGIPMPRPSYVNVRELRKREQKAVEEADLALSRIGVDVDERAQAIFGESSRTC